MDTRSRMTQQGEADTAGSGTEMAGRAADGQAALRREVVGGLLYNHHRANANTSKTLEVTSFAYALIELLIEKGLLTEEELNERKRTVAERLSRKFRENGMGVIRQDPECDKYTFDRGVEIDCASRVHLCQAACCRLDFALSRQDVEEGVLQWDLARPYMIAKDREGYCRHLDRCSSRCTLYEQRPASCRGYDCREDRRIWLDFARRSVNPDLQQVFERQTPATDGGRPTAAAAVSTPAPVPMEGSPGGQGPPQDQAARSRRMGAPEGKGNGAG